MVNKLAYFGRLMRRLESGIQMGGDQKN